MRNAKVSKILAASMAAAMLFSSVTVFAADITAPDSASSSIDGDGSLEGYVNKEAFRVVLPTIKDVNFTLDPQGLLNKANEQKYKQGAGAVYFTNAQDDGTTAYSNTSDGITIINKSSYDVEVGLSVTLETGDIALVAKDDLATVTEPSLYLGFVEDTSEAIAITDSSFESTPATVDAVPEVDGTNVTEGYEIKASTEKPDDNPDAKESPEGYYYSYGLTAGFADTDAEKVTYKLEGACDSKADWSGIDTEAVTANVAWTITKAGEPSISGSAYSRSNTANTYALRNVSQGIKSIQLSTDGTTPTATLSNNMYTLSDDKTTLTINGVANTFIGVGGVGNVRYFIITFDDNSTLTFSVNVTA